MMQSHTHTLPAFALTVVALLSGAAAAQESAVRDPTPTRASLLGPAHFSETDGAALYQAICQACHQANALGGAGAAAYPALAKNPKLENAGYPVWMVVNGNKAMPSFKGMLSDEQIAAVVGYVRSHFGNDYKDAISAEDVKQVRAAGK